jgi:hypothetical protein
MSASPIPELNKEISSRAHQRRLDCAAELEELIPVLREMVNRIRSGEETQPYVGLFWFRRRLMRILNMIRSGYGTPTGSALRRVSAYYRAMMTDSITNDQD